MLLCGPQALGRTCVLVAVGSRVLLALAIQDPVRPEARCDGFSSLSSLP